MHWPNNLPNQLTTFIGREDEIARLRSMLAGTRLLTLMGSGGSGKTRLALQLAALSGEEYPDGTWLVELGALSDRKLVAQIVASVLQLRENPDKSIVATLIEYLQPLKLMLILDNCEHLIEACSELAYDLLQACPGLTILATSRQGLGIEGETCWRVPSLTLPDPHNPNDLARLEEFEAVRLFLVRAKQRRPDFALTSENSTAVARLCYQLDGIPLAIELAAARVNVLSVEQIVSRLSKRFRLLSSSSQSALPRHKTLEAMMDWSYDLLSQREATLFRALSVFSGTFLLEAVQGVDGAGGDEFETINQLMQLADKSLLSVDEAGGEARYGMLETIQQYALEKAISAGEYPALRDRHLRWYVTLGERTEDELVGNKQGVWLERLEKEHENLRAALSYATTGLHLPGQPRLDIQHDSDNERTTLGLRLAGSLVWFWYFRGYISEGRRWLEGALAAGAEYTRTVDKAKALSACGVLAYLQSDYAVARERLEESLGIWQELDDSRGRAFALTFLGRVLERQGDSAGRELGEKSVALFREIGDKWGLALSLDFLGEEARNTGKADLAAALHDESLTLYRELGHNWGIALELSHFAQVALRHGDLSDAKRRLEEAVEIQRQVGDKWMLAWTLNNLGDAVRLDGDNATANNIYSESLALFREVGDIGGTAASLRVLSRQALAEGKQDTAWELSNESLTLFRGLGDRPGTASELIQLGQIALARHEHTRAGALFRESLTVARALGEKRLVAQAIRGLASIAAASEHWERAALLSGVADSTEQEGNSHGRAHSGVADHDKPARAFRGEQAASYQKGRTLPMAEAISVALHDDPNVSSWRGGPDGHLLHAHGNQLATTASADELTKREVEVLSMIAEGLTDAQVADRLILSTRTVQAHVRSIYSKLGITTRSAATRYAIQRGLSAGER
ncbi:MAG: tetratricopeptide repeat protein [Chloroflexota bacterium]